MINTTRIALLGILSAALGAQGQGPAFTKFGIGCPGPAAFYEQFIGVGTGDLTGQTYTFSLTPSGYLGLPVGNFDPVFTNNLQSRDDQVFVQPLGFTFPYSGGTTTSVDISSNGWIGLLSGAISGTQLSESGNLFATDPARIAVWWDDLNPASSGGLYADLKTGPNRLVVTYDQVPQFSNTDSNTIQCQLFENGDIVISWMSGCADDALVGFSAGMTTDPGSLDLSASVPGAFTLGGGSPLTLDSVTSPLLGSNLTLDVTNIDANTIALALNAGFTPLNVALDSFGMPGCSLYVGADASGPLAITPPSASLTLPIPNSQSLLCAQISFQAVALAPGINQLGVATSNGATAKLGGVGFGPVQIRASGTNTFNNDITSGFWQITNTGPDILSIQFDWVASSNSAQSTMVFDTDQTGMNDRFDAGNSSISACAGTYRNGSDATVGLVYAGTDTAGCDATATTGYVGTNLMGTSVQTLNFTFTSFGPGDVFEFDADTDGGAGIDGGSMSGMVVTVTTVTGTFSGELVMLDQTNAGLNL